MFVQYQKRTKTAFLERRTPSARSHRLKRDTSRVVRFRHGCSRRMRAAASAHTRAFEWSHQQRRFLTPKAPCHTHNIFFVGEQKLKRTESKWIESAERDADPCRAMRPKRGGWKCVERSWGMRRGLHAHLVCRAGVRGEARGFVTRELALTSQRMVTKIAAPTPPKLAILCHLSSADPAVFFVSFVQS